MTTYRAVLTRNQVKDAKKVCKPPEEYERTCDIEEHGQTVAAMLEAEKKGDFATSAELARGAAAKRKMAQEKREAEKQRKVRNLQQRKERLAQTVAA